MKIQHKVIHSILGLSLVIGVASCKKGFEELNKPYKDATVSTATPAGFFNNLAKRATEEDYTIYAGLFMPITNQQGVQNKNLPYINYITTFWRNYYQDLADYKQLLKLVSAAPNPGIYNDVKYMATILMSQKTLSMLDRYGDIPYSQAAVATEGSANYKPKYDKEESIYNSVLDDLKAAVEGVGGQNQSSIGTYESFLANDFVAWKKFGNALRLRYAVRLSKTNLQTKAKAIIAEILGNPSTYPLPNDQDLTALYKSNFGSFPLVVIPNSPDYGDRYWYAFRELSVSNIRMSSNVFAKMSSTNADDGSGFFDPRYKVWFMPNNAGKWVPQPQNGSVQDGGTPYPNESTNSPKAPGTDPGNKFAAFNYYLVRDFQSFPYVIISEADVHFLKAEIYNQGIGVGADQALAETEYNEGMKASVNFWYTTVNSNTTAIWPAAAKPGPITQAQIDIFTSNPAVKFTTGDVAGNYQKIITQSWLASMFNAVETWCTVRRTGVTPKDGTYTPVTYNRLPYPDDEKTNNLSNLNAIGGNVDANVQVAKKVYWMP
ncbi:SusD/RagB family nutrient-binding outer membrane lipoprotein [Pedobacter sp. KBS0701]|uniref:SusD/RagB family nutrient-binding outer membrane lipoprotein n=1 Tax=Pedobacter sp. KBS0701 TaxID=2578106 RepID=UPI00110E3274|nr:SusD/RagB family nutrient-binding outer membrane lipoprotein [Pedobacter sp. KBS0701]QDW26256.1 SusD/RagB family nutrient-binding outer membrane lipoprotein [Pedobacter sp. KBS0701]